MAQWVKNPTQSPRGCKFAPWLAQWVKDGDVATSCGVDLSCGSDPRLLGLGHRPAAAALIPLVAQRLPYIAGTAVKRKKKKQTTTKK